MKTRLAFAAAALVLTMSAPAAFAQSYTAPAGIPAVDAQGGLNPASGRYDDLTTGSIGRRNVDSSAKEGNADQTNKLVPNFGATSGGPAY